MKEKIKKILENYPKIDKTVRFLLNTFRWYKIKIVGYKAPKMLDGEIDFFKAIYKDCNTIVDVGARFDIDYIEISKGNKIKYFLFEVNPKYFKRLTKKLSTVNNESIIAENLAIGEKNCEMEYFEDSESLLKNTTAVKNSIRVIKKIKMIRLDEYFKSINISQIDFLKTDIEEYDYFALQGMGEILKNCKYIQFELGIGAPYLDRVVTNEDYYSLFDEYFNLYILQDENNPYLQGELSNINLFILNKKSKHIVEEAQLEGIGFNIVAINKNINIEKLDINIKNF